MNVGDMLATASEDLMIYQWQMEWMEVMGSTDDGGRQGISRERLVRANETDFQAKYDSRLRRRGRRKGAKARHKCQQWRGFGQIGFMR